MPLLNLHKTVSTCSSVPCHSAKHGNPCGSNWTICFSLNEKGTWVLHLSFIFSIFKKCWHLQIFLSECIRKFRWYTCRCDFNPNSTVTNTNSDECLCTSLTSWAPVIYKYNWHPMGTIRHTKVVYFKAHNRSLIHSVTSSSYSRVTSFYFWDKTGVRLQFLGLGNNSLFLLWRSGSLCQPQKCLYHIYLICS